ncbi:MAG: inositol monophosphatase family protein, partial [Aggregatilineales bacterium]
TLRSAARLCRTVQEQSLHSVEKDAKDPVTVADYGVQALIGRMLSEYYPDDAVIAEESGQQFRDLLDDDGTAYILNLLTEILDENVTVDQFAAWLEQGQGKDASRTWVIDPIDGTKGFIAMRHYAICLGVLTDGNPTGGYMVCPGYEGDSSSAGDGGMIFYVEDGVPYKMPVNSDERTQIQVSAQTDPTKMRIVQSFEREHAAKHRMARARELVGLNADHVTDLDSMEKYALVACGDADIFLRMPHKGSTRRHKIWDHAAGVALVLAAGGRATDLDGTPLDFSQGADMPNRGMIITNGAIHDDLVTAVETFYREEAGS